MTDRIDPRAGGAYSADGWTQIAWDATSLSTYMECPRKYQYRLREGWEPNYGSAALLYGRARHKAHEVFARMIAQKKDRDDALDAAIQAALEESVGLDELAAIGKKDERNKRTRANLVRAVVWWADEFGDDADPVQTMLLPDGTPAVELSWTLPLAITGPDGETYLMSGHFDRLVTYVGQPFVDEYKHTLNSLSSFYFKRFSPNVQISNYAMAARAILPDGAKGVLIEAEQVGVNFNRFDREFATRSPAQNDEWLATAAHWIKRAEADAQAEKAGDPHAWPMNETACGNYGGCPFREVCNKAPFRRAAVLAADFTQAERWDPLKSREVQE